MVADMSVGVYGMPEIDKDLQNIDKSNQQRNNALNELVKLKKIELTRKKPDVMFLFELLDFLKSLPQWTPLPPISENYELYGESKACFVGEAWNGKVVSYRDVAECCDFVEREGEIYFFDVNYYINKLSDALASLYEDEVD